jgi:hypothetical protein
MPGGDLDSQFVRDLHMKRLPLFFVHKTAPCLRMGIGISYVGFDVVDGGAVHEVCPTHVDDRT